MATESFKSELATRDTCSLLIAFDITICDSKSHGVSNEFVPMSDDDDDGDDDDDEDNDVFWSGVIKESTNAHICCVLCSVVA